MSNYQGGVHNRRKRALARLEDQLTNPKHPFHPINKEHEEYVKIQIEILKQRI